MMYRRCYSHGGGGSGCCGCMGCFVLLLFGTLFLGIMIGMGK